LRIRILLGLCAGLALAAPALAAPQIDPATGVLTLDVSSAGLDLSRADGATQMLARLTRAASAVCGGNPGPAALDRASNYRACMQEALDGAVARLGAPLIVDLYRNQGRSMLASGGELH
jgi:UrcA family protein